MTENQLLVHSHGRTLEIPTSEIQFTFAHSSGPGGQNVNKVASKAVLRWAFESSQAIPDSVRLRFRELYATQLTTEGDLVLSSQLTRDAPKNRQDCLDKLRKMLEQAMRVPRRRIATHPTRGSVRRRLETKRQNSEKKQGRRSWNEL
ncbi:MAG: alternative ribosome rescue aminoacyl-tRNA hydrolase ArfB [Thermoguttaceae bacterium]|nr:alternative ribosome rescue aminoacyl-tRNA hydrolase ArfB [Thermoguttaceae bacterium]